MRVIPHERLLVYGEIRKLWYATVLDRHFIKQLLQWSPGWSQQYKVVCVGQYINHIAANQGHREFPFGNSRESGYLQILGGNSREFYTFNMFVLI